MSGFFVKIVSPKVLDRTLLDTSYRQDRLRGVHLEVGLIGNKI
jgi:hypothetical protein